MRASHIEIVFDLNVYTRAHSSCFTQGKFYPPTFVPSFSHVSHTCTMSSFLRFLIPQFYSADSST